MVLVFSSSYLLERERFKYSWERSQEVWKLDLTHNHEDIRQLS